VSVISPRVDAHADQNAAAPELARANLVDVYHKFFDYRIVTSDADRTMAYKLRYDVYCEETGFLSKADNPSGLECDIHDAHSLHSVLIHRSSNHVAGTVRIVLPKLMMAGCAQPARLFSQALDSLPEAILPRARTGEISRFAIHPSFRRRLGDGLYARIFSNADLPETDFDPRRVIPHMTLGLFASIFEMTRDHGITHLCAVIDPALLRLLGRLGLHFDKAGPAVEFHGKRQPVYASCEDLLSTLEEEQPAIRRLIVSGH
jgi:N-acyl amino acid synthase of PEP-CTERM/exosortase system